MALSKLQAESADKNAADARQVAIIGDARAAAERAQAMAYNMALVRPPSPSHE